MDQTSEKLVRDAGGDATFVETNVTQEDSVKNAIEKTVEVYGKLDVLYNSAGGSIVEVCLIIPILTMTMLLSQTVMRARITKRNCSLFKPVD